MTAITAAPADTTPATTAALGLDDALITALVTSLFSARTAGAGDRTSARAAYQDALYGRAVLVDLRAAATRARDGIPAVPVEAVEPTGAGAERIRELARDREVILLSSDGAYAERLSTHLRHLGLPWVDSVAGGFTAWRAAGLPVAA